MSNVLEPAMAPVIGALAAPGTLVVLDFDGTLAPIQADRAAARPTRRSLRALRALAGRYRVAILSGRGAADVRARLEGVPVRWVIGSHGAEWPGEERRHRAWRRQVAGWGAALEARLAGWRGVEIEGKPLSVAVHYRRAPEPGRAAAAIREAIRELPGAVVVAGKRVVNLVPAGAGDKGAALERLAREAGAARVLFVGDDVTDEAAFAAVLPVPLVTVRVGHSRASRARHWVDRRADVDTLLERLVARAAPGRRAGGAGARGGGEALGPVLGFMKDLWALEQGLNQRSKAMLDRSGVTGPQRLVLRVVDQLGPVTQAELARVLHLHRSSVTRLVDRLERRHLVRRTPHPERSGRFLVELGTRGDRVGRRQAGTVEEAVMAALASVEAGDVAAATRVIRAVTARLRAGPSPRPAIPLTPRFSTSRRRSPVVYRRRVRPLARRSLAGPEAPATGATDGARRAAGSRPVP